MFKYQVIFFLVVISTTGGKETDITNETGGRAVQNDDENWVDTWEAPKIIKDGFPYYISGHDDDGRPILVMEWGHWDFRSIVEKGGENVEHLAKHFDQIIQRINTGFFTRNINDTDDYTNGEMTVIVDMDGLSLRQIMLPKNIRFLLENVTKIEKCFAKITYGYIINLSTVGWQLISLFKPYLGKFLERMEMYGTNSQHWKPKLFKRLPPSQLHPVYGGSEGFRPVEVYG
ncbi:unnamed protein product [Allacma fusca]|uniref:CRAL-TRIO domain-containing protein n=1 Tax=Allacma fusca TaxID=39272 RepID=A0A8J2NKI4_9HEXA|nr:unnamed protein product [Allacma fusca]